MSSPPDVVACVFARHLLDGQYRAAYDMVCHDARHTLTSEALERDFKSMMDGQAALDCTLVMEMDQWPGKLAEDLAWVYVAIEANVFSEAVQVIVCNHGDEPRIRHVEWGRP